jgi:hypothetical protein
MGLNKRLFVYKKRVKNTRNEREVPAAKLRQSILKYWNFRIEIFFFFPHDDKSEWIMLLRLNYGPYCGTWRIDDAQTCLPRA